MRYLPGRGHTRDVVTEMDGHQVRARNAAARDIDQNTTQLAPTDQKIVGPLELTTTVKICVERFAQRRGDQERQDLQAGIHCQAIELMST